MNVQETLGFPFKDSKWIIKMLIGGGLSFVALFPMGFLYMAGANVFVKILTTILFLALLVACLAPMGYAFKVLSDSCQGKEAALPDWNKWDVLFKDGLVAFGVSLTYMIVIAIIATLISMLSMKIPVLGSIFSLLQVVVGILILAAGPYLAVALAKYSETRNIISCFKFLEIIGELKSKCSQYLSVSLIVLGVVHVLKISLGFNLFQYMVISRTYWMGHSSFPLVALLSPFVFFWLILVISRMYGLIYSQKQEEPVTSS